MSTSTLEGQQNTSTGSVSKIWWQLSSTTGQGESGFWIKPTIALESGATRNFQFYADEIYHAGKRLSIWLRHIWLRGNHSTNIDRGGWASIDEIIQDEGFWMDVHRELLRHGHDHRKNSDFQTMQFSTTRRTCEDSQLWIFSCITEHG